VHRVYSQRAVIAATEKGLLDAQHAVLTPEYVEFDFVLAGLFSRFLAWFLDALIAVTVSVGIIFALSLVLIAFPGFSSAMSFVIWFLVDWGYAILLESVWSGQTLGKRVFGLRVIQESGVRIGFWHAALRNLARPVDRLPLFYLVGGATAFLSSRQQRLGDILAGTIVVRERRLKIPASLARPQGETSLLQDPQFRSQVARLSADEERVLLAAAMRREELAMEARLKLFAALSTRLQNDLGIFKPAHLSDEKLVLLVAAALAARASEKKKAPAKSRRFLT
jgi:uncharacterized RDD family membrane protein YckC